MNRPETLWASFYVSYFSKWFATEEAARAYKHDRPHQERRTEKAMRYLDQSRDAEKWARGQRYEHGFRVYLEFWPRQVTVYVDGWDNPMLLPCSVSRGETNWHRVHRYDVRFNNPLDGYDWYGRLATAGYNTSFKVRRLKSSMLLLTFNGNPAKGGKIIPAETPGFFHIVRHDGTFAVATHRNGKWIVGEDVPDVVSKVLIAE